MPRMRVDLEELNKLRTRLHGISQHSDGCCKYSLYDAAALACDAIREGLDGLHVVSDAAAIQAWKHGTPTYICYTQRMCLYYALGITSMKKRSGVWSVAVGFTNKDPVRGYNTIQTKRWPKGQPQIIIAAQCEHGDSTVMLKQPFIRPAYERNKPEMQRLMKEAAQRWIEKKLSE